MLTVSTSNLTPPAITVSNPYLPADVNKLPIRKPLNQTRKIPYKSLKNRVFVNTNNKQVLEAALIGFILSLGSLGLILAGSPLAILASILGGVAGLIGLRKIKKNPDKFSGKGLAWVGVIIGFLVPIVILGYLLAFAGAI